MTDNGQRGMYPLEVERPDTASQSLLARVDVCPYSAGLYITHKGGPRSAALIRGEVFHEVVKEATNEMIEMGEPQMPSEVVKDRAQAFMEAHPELSLPAREQEAVRLMAWNWGRATYLDLDHIVAVEQMFEMELGGWKIRGRIDRAEIVDAQAYVKDYKTSLALPSAETFESEWQSQLYGLLVVEGQPEGGSPLGKGLSGVHRIQEFPRYCGDDGKLATRYAFSDRAQLFDFKQTVLSHLAVLDHGLATGEWLATPGSHCGTCPAASACPIPAELREVRSIATMGEASEVAERILFLDQESGGLKKSLRAYADEHGSVPAGSDLEFAFTISESDRLTDKDGLIRFIEENGAQRDDYFKHATSTRFGKKKVTSATS